MSFHKFRNFITRSLLLSSAWILFPSSAALALNPLHPSFSLTTEEREAANQLRDLFARYVYPLDRDMVTFHYQSADTDASFRPTQAGQIINSADWGRVFFDPGALGGIDMVGPGHYVATDPSGSRTFGGIIDPQLYVVTLKVGTLLFDGRQRVERENKILNGISQSLNCMGTSPHAAEKTQNFTEPSEGSQLSNWFGFFRNSRNESCRKSLIQAVGELHIDATIYSYSATSELANCRHDRAEALSIISPNTLNEGLYAYFSGREKIDPSQIGGYIKRLYEEGLQDETIWNAGIEYRKILASLTPLHADEVDYEKWKAKYIFKCGPLWKTENGELNLAAVFYAIKDRDIGALKRSIEAAYMKKATAGGGNFQYLNFGYLRGYNKMVYLLAGLPSDFSQFETWMQAKRIVEGQGSDPTKTLLDAAQMLDETPTLNNINFRSNEYMSQFMQSLLVAKERPDVTFTNFKALGFGPRMTLLLIGNMLTYANAIPFVTGELPTNGNQNYSALMARNKNRLSGVPPELPEPA